MYVSMRAGLITRAVCRGFTPWKTNSFVVWGWTGAEVVPKVKQPRKILGVGTFGKRKNCIFVLLLWFKRELHEKEREGERERGRVGITWEREREREREDAAVNERLCEYQWAWCQICWSNRGAIKLPSIVFSACHPPLNAPIHLSSWEMHNYSNFEQQTHPNRALRLDYSPKTKQSLWSPGHWQLHCVWVHQIIYRYPRPKVCAWLLPVNMLDGSITGKTL